LRLVLVLGVTTGLRLAKMCTARLGDLRDELVDGRRVCLLHVVGKRRRGRDVVIHDDLKALIDRHQADMALAGIRSDPRAPVRSLLPPAPVTLVAMPGTAGPRAQLTAPYLTPTVHAEAPHMNGAGLGWTGNGNQVGPQSGAGAPSAGPMQPLIGHSSWAPGMYSYVLFRKAIEWAFESSKLPVAKLSPWPYPYDAALMVRHDLEDFANEIAGIEASAQIECAAAAVRRGPHVVREHERRVELSSG
jgi:hypothetical protein